MDARLQLVQLLEQLRGVRSPLARMRIMARGWQTLRQLSGTQLRQLGSQLGFDGAEQLLTRLARGKGKIDVGFFSALLAGARSLDPEEVDAVSDGLRDPTRRRALLRRSLDFVADEWLDEEEPEAGEARESPSAPVMPDDALESALEVPEPLQTAADITVSIPAPRDSDAAPVPEPAPVRAPAPTPAPPQAVVTRAPEEPRTTDSAPGPGRVRDTVAVPALQAGNKVAVPGLLVERLVGERRLARRLIVLRDHAEEARGLGVEGLREVLGAFPHGWAQRRALGALLERRIPDDLHRAVFLVEGLDSAAAERWCVATILEHWDLSPDERRALIERHGLTPVRRRRLALSGQA